MSQNLRLPPLPMADSDQPVSHVFIRNLRLDAQIGVYGHEHGRHQAVRINVDLAVDDTPPLDDRLDQVVDYDAITQRIRSIVAAGHVKLAETLAHRIVEACFVDPRVKRARVRVEKLNALEDAESAGVEIERRRQ
jgi:dihydroneopterin aldolase